MKEKIKEILRYERMTKSDMAKRIGVSRGAVSQWTIGITEPTPSHEKRIAQEFKWLNIYWLWGMEGNMLRDMSVGDLSKKVAEQKKTIELYDKLFKLDRSD
jgi:transcriptional regulator with XRE-family HTH domain